MKRLDPHIKKECLLEPWPNLQGLLSSSPKHNKILPNPVPSEDMSKLTYWWSTTINALAIQPQIPNSQVLSYLKNSEDVFSYKLIPGQTSYQYSCKC